MTYNTIKEIEQMVQSPKVRRGGQDSRHEETRKVVLKMTKNGIIAIENMGIAEVSESIEKFEGLTIEDLAVKETVDELATFVAPVKDAAKKLKDIDGKLGSYFKGAAKEATDEGKGVSAYSWDNGYKLVVTVGKDRESVNGAKLAELLREKIGGELVESLIAEATEVKRGNVTFAPKAIAKAELKKHTEGKMDDILVIG